MDGQAAAGAAHRGREAADDGSDGGIVEVAEDVLAGPDRRRVAQREAQQRRSRAITARPREALNELVERQVVEHDGIGRKIGATEHPADRHAARPYPGSSDLAAFRTAFARVAGVRAFRIGRISR